MVVGSGWLCLIGEGGLGGVLLVLKEFWGSWGVDGKRLRPLEVQSFSFATIMTWSYSVHLETCWFSGARGRGGAFDSYLRFYLILDVVLPASAYFG
jgi:hypothetical protein